MILFDIMQALGRGMVYVCGQLPMQFFWWGDLPAVVILAVAVYVLFADPDFRDDAFLAAIALFVGAVAAVSVVLSGSAFTALLNLFFLGVLIVLWVMYLCIPKDNRVSFNFNGRTLRLKVYKPGRKKWLVLTPTKLVFPALFVLGIYVFLVAKAGVSVGGIIGLLLLLGVLVFLMLRFVVFAGRKNVLLALWPSTEKFYETFRAWPIKNASPRQMRVLLRVFTFCCAGFCIALLFFVGYNTDNEVLRRILGFIFWVVAALGFYLHVVEKRHAT